MENVNRIVHIVVKALAIGASTKCGHYAQQVHLLPSLNASKEAHIVQHIIKRKITYERNYQEEVPFSRFDCICSQYCSAFVIYGI